jgi:Na+/proline symporter
MLRPPEGNLLGGMTPLYVISIFLIDIPFCLVDPSLWQRANAARSGPIIRRSMFVTAGVYFYWSAICVVLGVLGATLIPHVIERFGSTDAVIPVMVIHFLPPVVVGFCLAGLMAVMMSTASVALLISGTTVSNDLVRAFRPGISERGLLLSAKITVLIIGILGILFALYMQGIFDILLLAFAIYISGVFFPTMAALYWDKATKAGAVVSSIAATIVVIALYALNKPLGLEPIVVSLFISLVLMWAISTLTYRPETATPRLFPKA